MTEISEKFAKIELKEEIFKGIKFFISGDVHEKVIQVLKCGGAERMNYISEYVTHLIVGENPEETDVSDTADLYEIPALTPKWVLVSATLKKLVNTKPYLFSLTPKLFSNLVFNFSKIEDRFALWSLITYHGGLVHNKLTRKCNYLVTADLTTPKYLKAETLGADKIAIITLDWIIESIKLNKLADASLFHPKLIMWPKPPKPHESTLAITGFEPENVETVVKNEEKDVLEAAPDLVEKQALLEKLKQKMPWNQPVTSTNTSTSDPVAPPNVVAPSFLNKIQNNQATPTQRILQQSPVSSSFPNVPQSPTHAQQIPRSIVHHTPTQNAFIQQQQQQSPVATQQNVAQQQSPININRLLGQQQIRGNIPQIRGQIGQNQLHQQLLQQRMQQQNIIQRAAGQMTVQQQQLLQQQLAQGQRQLMQNQLINQQQNQQIIPGQQQQQQQQNQHMGQINQQLQHLQQLKQNQQQLMNQNQQIINQNQQQQQQQMINQNQHQQMLNPGNQLQNQQILPDQVIQQQQQNIVNQQQIPMNQQHQNFVQQNPQQGANQHILQHKQQMFNQHQVVAPQQQIMQNQQGMGIQQFIGHGIEQGQENIQQNKQNQQQNQLNQLSAQALNQQLTTQNLGQQLNQQQLNQQQNQQHGLEQGLIQNIPQQGNIQQQTLLNQQINQQNLQQQQQQQQQQLQINQQQQQQQQLNQQINQQPQLNPGINQQIIRTQFQGGAVVNQQLLLNQQQASQQQQQPQRAQLNQHLWAQQQQQQQQQQGHMQGQQIVRHPGQQTITGTRIQWSPSQQQGNIVPQRQFIQLDAHTHNQLQKMPPDQQALFVAKLQKQRQLQLAKQVQQRGGGHILIRGNVPSGLTAQQQVEWLQRQAKQQGIVLPPNIQQQNITPGTLTPQNINQNVQHAPGLSPINQNTAQFGDQNQQQLQLRQYRLQQLQLQREQAQKLHLAQQQGGIQQTAPVVRPMGPTAVADSTTNPPQVPDGNLPHSLVVNAKTKTALANMLSIKLQSGGSIGTSRPEPIAEPSAAGTLRLMTAQHNAALNSKPQEIIALQQRRVISGPNGEIIKPPAPQLSMGPQNEPPKLQFSQKPPVPVQHRVGPFYGHNPNLKLPPDLFLLGCIFVVVEVDGILDERIPGWQQKIEKYGGEVEKQYCNKVTHVICDTQRHGVVMQALRDCKRCVTVFWLKDVMKRKQVLPPWTALHLPQIYLDITPAAKHLISISGFEGPDRQRIKTMIKYTGARCTTYFSKHNTLLICAKAEGKKFNHAKKWGTPVVNVQWLTDVILGNFTALNQMDHQVYQTFSNPPNMTFDPKLVPNMMHAWKAPINISQESYERVKRSASPVLLPKAKKQKTEHIDENDNISEEISNTEYRVLFTQFGNEKLKELEKIVRELGGAVARDHTDFTHLVMPSLIRTTKLFYAVCKNTPIVSDKWITESHTNGKFLPENPYQLESDEFNTKYNVNFTKTLQCYNRDKLFTGKYFWITPSVFPTRRIVTELVQSCGGVVERVRRSSAHIEATNLNLPSSYFILTTQQDLHLVADLLKNKKDKQRVVCNVEFVLSAILKQNLEVEPYAVSIM